MKLRYLFSAILSSALLFAGCQPDTHESFDNVKLSQSYLSIPEDGGSVEMTVTSNEAWKFIINEKWPEVVTFNKDNDGKTIKAKFDRFGNLINDAADIKGKTPSWLAVSVLEGQAGDTKVIFSAEGTVGGREIEVALLAGNNKQFVRVRQGVMEATAVSCKEANELPEGKSVILKGTVTAIENTTYGNWTLVDDTGSMYIYGTLDKKGATKNFASLGLEAGDVVEVEGPIGSYNGKKQLVNVMVNSITKSLVKLVSEEQTVSKDGGEFDVTVAYKGESVLPSIPQEYRSWVSIVDMRTVKGVPTKIEQNPADTAFVKISLQPNTAGERTGAVAFSSSKGASTSSVTYNFTQESGETAGPGGADYETTLAYEGVDAFYDDGVATINGVSEVKVLKFGTSKKAGECLVVIPAGSKKIVFYGIGWSGKDDVLTASFATFKQGEVTLKANSGATGNSPYTITAADSDYYTIEFNVPVQEDMPLTLKSTARCIIWGLQAKTE